MACVAPVRVAWHPALPSSPPNLIYWGRKVGWRTGISPTRSGPEGSSRNEFRPGRSVRPSTLVAGLFADGPCSDPVTSELGRRSAPMAVQNEPSGYRVLARKYRPSSFDGLIGQEALVRTLSNAIQTGRIAHAFLLTGVRGIGKTNPARTIPRPPNSNGPASAGGPTPRSDHT